MNRRPRKTKPPIRYYTFNSHGEYVELDAPVPRVPPEMIREQLSLLEARR